MCSMKLAVSQLSRQLLGSQILKQVKRTDSHLNPAMKPMTRISKPSTISDVAATD